MPLENDALGEADSEAASRNPSAMEPESSSDVRKQELFYSKKFSAAHADTKYPNNLDAIRFPRTPEKLWHGPLAERIITHIGNGSSRYRAP
jgi:hypothetical protein